MRFFIFLKSLARKPIWLFVAITPRWISDPVVGALHETVKGGVRLANYLYGAAFVSWRDPERWRSSRRVAAVMPRSMVGWIGLSVTDRIAQEVARSDVPGDFVELGVARGGSAALLADAALRAPGSRDLWLFDSFEGLPEPTEQDIDPETQRTGNHIRPLPRGACLGTLDDVQDFLLRERAYPSGRIHFVQGWFQDTLPKVVESLPDIAVLRLDGDWYESTKVCLNYLYDKVAPGGAVIIDDYESCYGCKLAVTEFFDSRGEEPDITLDGRGGAFMFKIAREERVPGTS